MIKPTQLRTYVIQPVLSQLGHYSPQAEELLMLTAAQESAMGKYIHQLGRGPACGIFQMEPRTHDDLTRWMREFRPDLYVFIQDFKLNGLFDPPARQMCGNFYYAAAMARTFYLRVPTPLPSLNNLQGMAAYYKKHWNTHLGAATVEQAISNYKKYA